MYFLNSSIVISDAPQTEITILAGTLTVAEDLSKVRANTTLPETPSIKTMSRVTSESSVVPKASSVDAFVKPSWKTTAEAATVTAAGSQETTAERRVTSSETVEKVETATNAAQTIPIKLEKILTKIVPTRKSEVDTTRFISQSVTNRITNERKKTTKAGTEDKFRTSRTTTGTNTEPVDLPADLTTEKMVPDKVEKPREPSKVETRKTTTVRPKESSQATKTPESSSTMKRATSVKYTTENTDKKQFTATIKSRFPHISTAGLNTISPVRPTVNVFNKLTTLSPCKGKCKTTSTAKSADRRDNGKVLLAHDKTLYSAITMGCILVLCTILAFIVFIKDFVW